MSNKYSSAHSRGIRDGADAYLLDRELDNPFDENDNYTAFELYNSGWHEGYDNEAFI